MSIKLGEINAAIHLLDEGIAGARDLVSILQPVVQKSSIETLQNRILNPLIAVKEFFTNITIQINAVPEEEEEHNEEEDQNEEETEEESEEEESEHTPNVGARPLPLIRKCPNSYSSAVPSKEVPKVNRNLPFKCLLIKIGKDKYNHKYYSKFRMTWDKLISTLELFEKNNPNFDLSDIRENLTSPNETREQLKEKLNDAINSWRLGHPKNGEQDKPFRNLFKNRLSTLIEIVNDCIEEYGNSI